MSKKNFINLHSAAFVTVFARNLVHAYKFRIFQKNRSKKVFINLKIPRSIINKYTLQVSRTLKTGKAFKWGLKYNQFSPQILCLQVSVNIIHWHCFQVSYARANLAKRENLHRKGPSVLSVGHVAAARKRGHQWCVSLTPNNTKTMGRMTCHCFQRPIRRDLTSSSYITVKCCILQDEP